MLGSQAVTRCSNVCSFESPVLWQLGNVVRVGAWSHDLSEMQSSRNLRISSLVARAWSVRCNSWKGIQYAHGGKALWTVRFETLLERSGNFSKISSNQIQAAANCAKCARCNVHELNTAAWDGRHLKKSRPPDFLHKDSEEALSLNNFYNRGWPDGQLVTLDAPMDRIVPRTFPWGSPWPGHADQLVGPEFENRFSAESVKKLCHQGDVKEAVEVLEVLVETNSSIDKYLFYSVLKECVDKKDLLLGGQVHALAVKMGYGSDTFLCNHFIRMYAGHGKLQAAMDVFRGLALPDAFTWASIISAHVKQRQAEQAIELYQHMRGTKIKPDGYVLVAALQACAAARNLQTGRQIHDDAFTSGMKSNLFVCNSLVDMYAKCGSLTDARRVFDTLCEKDIVTWNAMITGYAQQEGMGQEALSLYKAMRNAGVVAPNAVTFVCLLQACAHMGVSALDTGKQLHLQLKDRKLESDVFVGGSLVNMYVKCGSLQDARLVFNRLTQKNLVTWNAMISGYAQQEGMGQEALNIYSTMCNNCMAAPDAVTFVCLLQACANMGVSALEMGKKLHSELKDRGLESDVVVGGSLVNMFAKCGSLEDARIVFDKLGRKNVITWNVMISGYAQQEGMGQQALNIYNGMRNEEMAAPDAVTFVSLLQACANVGMSALETGKHLHSQVQDLMLESDVVVGGSLVNMYAKCGSLKDARRVFDRLNEKNVVTWNAMIAGYAQEEGMGQEALNMYGAMRNEGMATPNAVTYVCLLEACASVGALHQGKQLHSEIREEGFESNALVGNCLVKMYAKYGLLEVAREVLDRLPSKNLVTWSALLKGYADHGQGCMAITCFEEMLEHGIQPDEVTYICLLLACSHAGLVDQAQQYFETMMSRHGIEPTDRHYNCMVDLLGRLGHLDKAEKLLRASDLAGSAVGWTALLSACKSHGDAETGQRCFDQLVQLEPTAATAYVLLGNIYANAGRWDEVDRVESLRKAAGARKMPGKACIEVKEEVHEFTVGEERSDVAATLRKMNMRAKQGGHVPQTQLVLRAVSDKEKEDALCGHAEKLALAYGLLHTPAGSTLVVTKNLRMCTDCHSSTKIMSRLESREIVVRDGHKVHRFQNGACSCQDRP